MKYERLKKLEKTGINIPKFFLFDDNLEQIKKFETSKIILRSSYKEEDGEKKSFAGIFTSIGGIDKTDINLIKNNLNIIKKDAEEKISKINGNLLDFGIIIQEYIESDFGGVIFVEGEKKLIELNLGNGAEKVVNGETLESIFIYKDFLLRSTEKNISKNLIKKILTQISAIKSIYNFDLDIEFGIKNNEVIIFQVRPITQKILNNYYLLDNSNIGENFVGETSTLTASFVKRLYSKVYKSVAYNSGISFENISKIEHIFDDLIVYKDKKLLYNIISWYKLLFLFPGDNKKSFDKMIGAKTNLKYLYLDDVYDLKPNFLFKIKYFFIILYKILTFDYKIKKLDKYLQNFYKNFDNLKLEDFSLNDLYLLYREFEQNLSFLWYITIDNDFVIMKLSKNLDLKIINGLASAKQIFFLKELSEGKKTKEEYLEKYGHRFGDELKLESEEINDSDLEQLIKIYKNIDLNPKSTEIKETRLSKYLKNREKFRLYRAKNFSVARKIFLEIERKFLEKGIIGNKGEIFNLEIGEIFEKILSLNKVSSENNDEMLIGEKFSGKVYVLETFHIPEKKPEIIIAKSFDPGWIILLGGIKGIILENGNMLSHISIICRELKIPLLIGVKNATKIYKNGDFLEITNNGEIICKNI